ncbi:unnamed protein product [Clonostachys chloroleuca]|uniref:Glutathione S-transferase n=1 Tax=Clonostachys chloroleuca TaxID=1926264 RepID=A0AA35PZ43_9HYPO|nr:unnamed protein product [Clonostachys chloroleuca]
MPEITLYMGKAGCALGAHILLEEIGIPYSIVIMEVGPSGSYVTADGSMSIAEYREKIHHDGFVPALKVSDEVITENPAILSFIASMCPERKLLGKAPIENAHVIKWLTWISGTLHGYGYGMLTRPARFSKGKDLYPKIRDMGRVYILDCYSKIEVALQGRKFPIGDAESLVDYYLVPFWHFGATFGFDMSLYPEYLKLVCRIESKEAAKRVLEEEGVEPAA